MEISRQRILVVEDDPLIRMLAVDELQEAGLAVIEAADAKRALEIIARHPEVAILFTDIDMPGEMNGIGLANAVHDRWPPIKIVITSGQWTKPVCGVPAEAEFIAKPYDCEALSRYFASILN